jgi:hypothetical protein
VVEREGEGHEATAQAVQTLVTGEPASSWRWLALTFTNFYFDSQFLCGFTPISARQVCIRHDGIVLGHSFDAFSMVPREQSLPLTPGCTSVLRLPLAAFASAPHFEVLYLRRISVYLSAIVQTPKSSRRPLAASSWTHNPRDLFLGRSKLKYAEISVSTNPSAHHATSS